MSTADTDTTTLLKVGNISPCCRCQQAHLDGLFFAAFKSPVRDDYRNVQYTHWALCPITGEPLLVAVLPPPIPEGADLKVELPLEVKQLPEAPINEKA